MEPKSFAFWEKNVKDVIEQEQREVGEGKGGSPYGRRATELILAQPLNLLEKTEFVILHKEAYEKQPE